MKKSPTDVFGILIAALLVMPLAACNSDDYVSVHGAPGELNKQQRDHKYPGKPQAAVDIDYQVNKAYAVEEASDVTIVVTSRKAADALTVVIHGREDQLLISGGQSEYVFGSQRAGQRNEIVLGVTPRAAGLHYIGVNARLTVDGHSTSRSFAIPVNTAPENIRNQMKPAGVIKLDPSGERVIIMPAMERAD
jgi:hypothetical protein